MNVGRTRWGMNDRRCVGSLLGLLWLSEGDVGREIHVVKACLCCWKESLLLEVVLSKGGANRALFLVSYTKHAKTLCQSHYDTMSITLWHNVDHSDTNNQWDKLTEYSQTHVAWLSMRSKPFGRFIHVIEIHRAPLTCSLHAFCVFSARSWGPTDRPS